MIASVVRPRNPSRATKAISSREPILLGIIRKLNIGCSGEGGFRVRLRGLTGLYWLIKYEMAADVVSSHVEASFLISNEF
jgi:hypothetical protein